MPEAMASTSRAGTPAQPEPVSSVRAALTGWLRSRTPRSSRIPTMAEVNALVTDIMKWRWPGFIRGYRW